MQLTLDRRPFSPRFWLIFSFVWNGLHGDKNTMTVEEGLDVSLPCSVADAANAETGTSPVVWLMKNDSSELSEWTELGMTEYGKAKSLSKYSWIAENLTLMIGRTEMVDSGFYMCSVFNTSADLQAPHHQIQLTVYERKTSVEPPKVSVLGPLTVYVEWISFIPDQNVSYSVLVRDKVDTERVVDASEGESHCKVDNLLPNTDYQFVVRATDSEGQQFLSSPSEWIRTGELPPAGVVRIVTWRTFTEGVTVDFELPPVSEWNGNLTGFIVIYSSAGSDLNTKKEFAVVGVDKGLQTLNVSHLLPFTIYEIKIAVFNEAGMGPLSDGIRIRTEEGVPSKPRILNIPARNDSVLTVHWEQPERVNGQLLGYNLFWSSYLVHDSCQVNAFHTKYELTQLSPYTEYGIQVSAFTKIGSGPKSDVHHAVTDTAAPGVPLLVNISSNESEAITVRWWRPMNFTKQIDLYYLRYREQGDDFYTKVSVKQTDILQDFHEIVIRHLVPNIVYEFQVAAVTRSIFTDQEYVGLYSEPQMLAVTDDLPDEEPDEDVEEDNRRKANLMTLGVVCGILFCLTISSALIVFVVSRHFIRRRYQFIADQDLGKQPVVASMLSEIYDPNTCFKESVPADGFRDHVTALHSDGDYLLSQEYEEVNRLTPSNSSTSQSCEEENKQKNRYLNILAYDHSRVLLTQLPGKPRQSDYINANFVNGYKQAKAYIATQGPLPSTFSDFWRMVWEQESSVIVMITNLTEKGRRKCDQYWPLEGEHHYDNIAVRLVNTRVTAHYTVRSFTIRHLRFKKKLGGDRTVTQYHYTDWPDHGVPTFTLPTLTFIRKSSVPSTTEGTGPVIVHCSAGVGRTGTYIVIDSMIKQIKDVHSVNIFCFLCHIRNFRNYLVQTEDQYSFIHDAILEYIESDETEVKSADFSQYVRTLQGCDSNAESLLEKQFKLVTSFVPKPYHLTSALAPVNESKNRSTDIVPVELSRVFLPTKAGVDGSNYINATFLQGYRRNEEYIVTQHPMTNTVDDFWHMVWDQNSDTIVLLSAVDELEFKQFWPDMNEVADYGNFQVSFRQEEKVGTQITNRDFILQSTQDDYECTVRMIEHSTWPECCASMNSVYELVQMAKAWNFQLNEDGRGPVVVIDRFGGAKAVTFCAIAALSDQLLNEGSIDVYAVAKLYHMKRPGVFPSVEDYQFLYRALEGIHCQMNNHCKTEAKDPEATNQGNCNNTHAHTLPHSTSHNSVNSNLSNNN